MGGARKLAEHDDAIVKIRPRTGRGKAKAGLPNQTPNQAAEDEIVRVEPNRTAEEEIVRLNLKIQELEIEVVRSNCRNDHLQKTMDIKAKHHKEVEDILERVLQGRSDLLAEKDKRIESLEKTLGVYSDLSRKDHVNDF
jgi:predicted RNase H-like nuclease (RuvC/YqgF family)